MTEPVLHLVDGHGIGHRAYHAAGGRGPIAALSTFASMLDRLERDHRPQRAVIAFDPNGRTWRHELFPAYKAHRPAPEPALLKVLPKWRPMAAALGWPTIMVRGFEADDVLATIVTRARELGWRCVVHASDKDLMALVGDDVHQITASGAELGPAEVEAKMGVPPGRIADYLAIAGDAGDGVPGVTGAGAKRAAELCRRFATIEALIGANPKVGGRYPLSTIDGTDALRLSRRLVELMREVPLELAMEAMVIGRRSETAVRELLAEPRPAEQLGLGGLAPPAAPRSSPPTAEPMTGEQLERFRERAAIREFDGGLTRTEAERLALDDVGHRRSA